MKPKENHDQQVNVRFQAGEMEVIDALRMALYGERGEIVSRSELIREVMREYISRNAKRLRVARRK